MPIIRKSKQGLLFIHIPKTGGGSVEAAFRADGWSVNILDGNMGKGTINHYRHCTPQHIHGSVLQQLYKLDRFDGIFTYVRDPLRRTVSEYLWRNQRNENLDPGAPAFEAWVREAIKKTMADPYVYDNHMRPQHEFLVPGTRVYKFEDGLETGLADLERVTGLEIPSSVPRNHSGSDLSGVSSSDVQINDNIRKLVADFYAEDYRIFGYTRPDA
ncbi:sulfotransferase family 2 domain-containing protein [Demequina flava]|uniref:sulfotransferase family 2 domain-containing protein n=1 Tax=Demequina flava TaxID=1095025 RepID=UPI000782E5BD|nr:sulfotransferase family 2 domain-containing protein [Demequina flava]